MVEQGGKAKNGIEGLHRQKEGHWPGLGGRKDSSPRSGPVAKKHKTQLIGRRAVREINKRRQ